MLAFEAFDSGLLESWEVAWDVPMAARANVGVGAGSMDRWVGRGAARHCLLSRPWMRACVLGAAPGGPLRGLRQRSSAVPGLGSGRGHACAAPARDGAGLSTEEMVEGGSHEKRRPQPGTPWRRWWSPRAGAGGREGTKEVRSRATQPRGGPTSGGIVGSMPCAIR